MSNCQNKIHLLSTVIAISVLFNAFPQYLCERDSLEFAVVLFRHGDRTPVEPYPTDPYKSSKFWPEGYGELLNQGKLRHYRLGKYLRQRYEKFLKDGYSPSLLKVRSTDTDRTLSSALANLAGMFPPTQSQNWNPDLNWQPIPVHTVPQEIDRLLSSHALCPRVADLKEMALESSYFYNIDQKHQDLYTYISKHAGEKVKSVIDIDYIYDTLFIEKVTGKTLPAWTNSVFPDKMVKLRNLSFKVDTWYDEMKRLVSGPLLVSIGDLFKSTRSAIQKNNSSNIQRLQMYSGHDTTLANLLNSLNMFDPPHPPNYAATLVFELHKNSTSNNFFVKFFYFKSDDKNVKLEDESFKPIDDSDFIQLTIPSCEGERKQMQCNLDKFLNDVVQPLTPSNYDYECRPKIFQIFDEHTIVVCGYLMYSLILFLMMAIFIGKCRAVVLGKGAERPMCASDRYLNPTWCEEDATPELAKYTMIIQSEDSDSSSTTEKKR